MKIPVIDIFAGPGGLGEGFSSFVDENNSIVFNIALSIEMQSDAHNTLELRSFFRKFPKEKVPEEYYQYLRGEIKSKEELFNLFPLEAEMARKEAWCAELGKDEELNIRIDSRINEIKKRNGDGWILIGGPPCQAYSVIGRSRNKGRKDYSPESDPKSYLYKEYLRIIAKHKPALFVMENVKGLLSSKLNGKSVFEKIINDLENPKKSIDLNNGANQTDNSEYQIFPFVLPKKQNCGETYLSQPNSFIIESENFGIPQSRHRVILLGMRKIYFDDKPSGLSQKNQKITVEDILSGLPKVRSGLSRNKDSLTRWKKRITKLSTNKWFEQYQSPIKTSMLNAISEIKAHDLNKGGQFVSGDVSVIPDLESWFIDRRIGGACNHEARSHMASDLHRYLFSACYSNEIGISPRIEHFPKALIPKHKNARTGKFNDRFRVQTANAPSSTITSHISKDGHYFIHYDPAQCRSLTVREAARLQTFPDNYFFEGSRTQQYIQVGNAVPPLLAKQLAEIIYNLLKGSKLNKRTDILTPEKRSWNMSRIKNKDTKPEIRVRSLLYSLGYGYRLHRKDLPGKPDIVLPKYNKVIFVHGCFWHRHKGCNKAYKVKSNIQKWKKKFKDNVARDQRNKAELEKLGWGVHVIWECETKNKEKLEKIVNEIFSNQKERD